MRYLVGWTEYHSAIVEAKSREEAEHDVIGIFDADDTYDGHDSISTVSEDDPNGEDFDDGLTVPSKGGAMRSHANLLYDACVEFVRKCECGEARSRRSYREMKHVLDLINNPEERTDK
jgi:hypothetical protein